MKNLLVPQKMGNSLASLVPSAFSVKTPIYSSKSYRNQNVNKNLLVSSILDQNIIWRNHISAKRKQLDLKLRNMYWIVGRKSQISLPNKLLVYKAILKPIWTYGIQLWGTASNSNMYILERFQSKVL